MIYSAKSNLVYANFLTSSVDESNACLACSTLLKVDGHTIHLSLLSGSYEVYLYLDDDSGYIRERWRKLTEECVMEFWDLGFRAPNVKQIAKDASINSRSQGVRYIVLH